MKYRSRADIIATILEGAGTGASKTRLMYGAYLSYSQIQEYLEFLLSRGLIMLEEENQQYKLTEKGIQFLRIYEEISELVAPEKASPSVPDG